MNLADELFGPETVDTTPPEARRWEHFLARGIRPVCSFVRRRDGIAWTPASIVISYPDASPPVPSDPPVPWDEDLERWLLDHKIRAESDANEAERFGYGLTAEFRPIERRCGSGYFNSILVQYLRDRGFADEPAIREKLASIHAAAPSPSEAMVDYAAQVKAVLATTARTIESLGYDRQASIDILAKAIAYYLDDRFNIHTRALLGFA
jgi:hypothetical protein